MFVALEGGFQCAAQKDAGGAFAPPVGVGLRELGLAGAAGTRGLGGIRGR